MKYTCSVTINKPIDQVVALWHDKAHFSAWQDGFQHIKHIEGIPHTVGAVSEILIQNNKHTIELKETIITNDLPREKRALYEHKHMTNTQCTRFKQVDENTTTYISEVEYIKFNGFMIKLMAKLFPGKFKAQSQKWMDQFKVFAESI